MREQFTRTAAGGEVTGRVGKLEPGQPPKYQDVGPGVNPITMSEDESRLFVGWLFLGSGLYELDLDFDDP